MKCSIELRLPTNGRSGGHGNRAAGDPYVSLPATYWSVPSGAVFNPKDITDRSPRVAAPLFQFLEIGKDPIPAQR
jgi:hypothetical protein